MSHIKLMSFVFPLFNSLKLVANKGKKEIWESFLMERIRAMSVDHLNNFLNQVNFTELLQVNDEISLRIARSRYLLGYLKFIKTE